MRKGRKMMSMKEFQKLEVGDVLEFGPLFPGLDNAPVYGAVMKVQMKNGEMDAVELSMDYRATFIGAYRVKCKGMSLIVLSGGMK